MKIMGIDVGTKNTGIAISDEERMIAFPFGVVSLPDSAISKILSICEEEQIGTVVLGYTKSSGGDLNRIREKLRKELQENGLAVEDIDESFTSAHSSLQIGKESLRAHKTKKVYERKNDSQAAVLILQRYLEQRGKGRGGEGIV